jgi:hypothetical protein
LKNQTNKTSMKATTFLVFATAFAAAIYSTNAELIINGGFETPDTPSYMYIYPGQTNLAPWVVGSPYVEVGDAIGNGFITGPAFEGVQMLDLHGRLTQTFATTPGSLYTVTFAYTDNPAEPVTSPPARARVRLFDGLGNRLVQTNTHIGALSNNFHWTVFNGQFTAVTNTTSLEFTPLTTVPDGDPGGIIIDAVQVFAGDRLQILSISGVEDGSPVLGGRGVPKGLHRIQASPDLSGGGFIDIATVTADAYGLFQFKDTRTGLTRSFYRVVFP